jgi:hypothetical protein
MYQDVTRDRRRVFVLRSDAFLPAVVNWFRSRALTLPPARLPFAAHTAHTSRVHGTVCWRVNTGCARLLPCHATAMPFAVVPLLFAARLVNWVNPLLPLHITITCLTTFVALPCLYLSLHLVNRSL